MAEQETGRDSFGEELSEILGQVVRLAGFRARIEYAKRGGGEYYANVRSKRSDGLLIGRSGETLRALQMIVNSILQHRHKNQGIPNIIVDVGGYKKRREDFLQKKALAVAKIVQETGREMSLDPLTEKEMGIVKEALAKLGNIRVHTVGSGYRKNVIIAPKE